MKECVARSTFQVAMHNVNLVKVLNTLQHLPHDALDFRTSEPDFVLQYREEIMFHVLEYEECGTMMIIVLASYEITAEELQVYVST